MPGFRTLLHMASSSDDERAVLPYNEISCEFASDDEEEKEEKVIRVNQPKRLVILEPILLLFATCMIMEITVLNQYMYYTIGHRYNLTSPNETRYHKCKPVEDDGGNERQVVNKLQEIVTMWHTYMSVAYCVCSLIVTPFFSAATDRLGRKWPMMIVSVGVVIRLTINFFVMIFELPLLFFVLSSLIMGLTGGMGTLFAALFSYLADITTPENRPLRIAILEAMFGISGVVSEIGVGFWLKVQTYWWPYGCSVVISVINLIYVFFFVPEVRKREGRRLDFGKFCEDQKRVFQTFMPSKNQAAIPMILVMMAFFIHCVQGFNFTISQEYEMGYPFCWDSVYLGIYSGVTMFSIDVGLVFAAFVFTKFLKIQTLTSATIGILSSAASKTCQGLAPNSTWLFISELFTVLLSLRQTLQRINVILFLKNQ